MSQAPKEQEVTRRAVARTNAGRVRSQNQDAFKLDDAAGLWIVADGMGGNRGGEVASRLACDRIHEEVAKGEGLDAAIRATHDELLHYSQEHPDVQGLGTTLVVVQELPRKQSYRLYWVGDSRIYLWRDNRLTQLSEDHGVVQRLVKAGKITEAQARVHPQRHVITSCLGGDLPTELEVGARLETWRRGDRLLLCSDGLTDELEDAKLNAILCQHSDDAACADALMKAALDAGGRDNVSVVLISAPENAKPPAGRIRNVLSLVGFGFVGAGVALGLILLAKYLKP